MDEARPPSEGEPTSSPAPVSAEADLGRGDGGASGDEAPFGAGPAGSGPREALALEVDRRLRAGILVTVVGVVLLSLLTALDFWDTLGIPVFHLLLPALALAQLPLIRSTGLERIPVYLGSAVTILTIGTIGLLLGLRLVGWEGLGLRTLPAASTLLWTLGLTVAGLVVIVATIPLDAWVDARRTEAKGAGEPPVDLLGELLPRTRGEKGAFVGLSFAAGLGEELAYRGYALVSLQLLGTGPWVAAGLSSVAFGFLHAYQGPVGIVRTGGMGFLLALPVLLTGSLVPAMLAHTLIDLIGGLLLGPRLRRPLVEPPSSG